MAIRSTPTPALLADHRRPVLPDDPDDLFALLKKACQGAPHPDALPGEVSRRAAHGALGSRDLHQVLLVAADRERWAAAREAAWAAAARAPEHAVTILHLEAQRSGTSLGMAEGTAEGVFTAQASFPGAVPVIGQLAHGTSKKAARQAAALSLLAALADFPDPAAPAVPATAPSVPTPPEPADRELAEWLDFGVARDHPEPALAEALTNRRMTVRMLYLLLFETDPRGWAELRAAAWEQLCVAPHAAGGVLALRTQAKRWPSVTYLEVGDTTSVAVTEDEHGLLVGEPATAATRKGARAAAARAMIEELMPPLAAPPEPPAETENPIGELNQRAQIGEIEDLRYKLSATGPPHAPDFICTAACARLTMELSATAAGRSKAEAKAAAATALIDRLAEADHGVPHQPARTAAAHTRHAAITGRMLRAGCGFGYWQGRLELGPLPEPLTGWTATLAQALPGLATAPGPWGEATRAVLEAVAEQRVHPSVDASGRDRWLPLLAAPVPEPVPADYAGDVADLLLRPPGAQLVMGQVRYASPPRVLADRSSDWADRCAERANPTPPQPIIIRIHPGDTPRAELSPERLGEPELRVLRRAARQWPPLDRIRRGETALTGTEVTALLARALPGITVEWPSELARQVAAGTVLRTEGGYSSTSAVAVDWRLFLDGDPLTDEEQAAVAGADGMVWLRGRWVVADPALLRRQRPDQVTGAQALAAALTGQITMDGWRVPCAPGGGLRELVVRLRQGPGIGVEVPPGLTAALRDYQRRALDWLARVTAAGFGALLADEMGLGKTLAVIAYHLHRNAQQSAPRLPALVVCPASLMANWEREFGRFAPGVAVRRYHGPARDLTGLAPGAVVVTSYGTMTNDAARLAGTPWTLVVADEAQQIKNHRSQVARALRAIPAETRIAVTGTPVENTLTDLWAILDWTNPGLFGTLSPFRQRYGEAERNPGGEAATALARLIGPFVLRRRKSDPGVAPELPEKVISDRFVTLTAEQAALYRAVTSQALDRIRTSSGIARRGHVLRLLQALRQICNSPAQYLRESPTGWDPDAESARSGKLQALEELLEAVLTAGEAALVFTGYVSMGHLLMAHLTARGAAADFLHGGVPVKRRQELVDRFQAGTTSVLVLSVQAAGVGLNLTRASHVIHVDRPWNPAVEDQATDRAHRIGRHDPVQVHHLIAEGTVEDRIAELLARKRQLTEAVLVGGETALTELDDAELAALIELSGGTT